MLDTFTIYPVKRSDVKPAYFLLHHYMSNPQLLLLLKLTDHAFQNFIVLWQNAHR